MDSGLVYEREIELGSSPERVWEALVNPELASRYHLAPLYEINLKPDGKILYGSPESPLVTGTVRVASGPKLLRHTFRFAAEEMPATEGDPESLVEYQLEAIEDGRTRLSVRHSGFRAENQTYANISQGWPRILEQLKALLDDKAADA